MNLVRNSSTPKVQHIAITEQNHSQRLDNFLLYRLKGVPKTRIYRLIRKGEVRVNKGRVDHKYRLNIGDMVRIPPVRVAECSPVTLQPNLKQHLQNGVLYEDDALMVLDKPAGFAVHGGSGISSGVIEGLRQLQPHGRFLELVHRLDKDTSGCLLVAKKRSALTALQQLFRDNMVHKTYLALLVGNWDRQQQVVTKPLLRSSGKGGERVVKISENGKYASTNFRKIHQYEGLTLVKATPKTGRTHQIRVHAAFLGHPIVADSRYGDAKINQQLKIRGYRRLFLHALQLQFIHPVTGVKQCICAKLAGELSLQLMKCNEQTAVTQK